MSTNLGKGIRYDCNGLARNGLTRYITGLSFCVEDIGMHAWRRTSLIDSRTEVLARTTFDNLSVINNDCGARAGDSRSNGRRDRRIRLIPVLSVLHLFFFASAASSLVGSTVCSCHTAFSVCGSSGTSGTRPAIRH